MINNQFNRRNISDCVRGELALALKARLRERAEKNSSDDNRYTQPTKKEANNECSNLNTRIKLTDKEQNLIQFQDTDNEQDTDCLNLNSRRKKNYEDWNVSRV